MLAGWLTLGGPLVRPADANTLSAGDMVVLGWNAIDDTVRFATLVDLPAGTVITITDRGWNQATNAFTSSTTGDGDIIWTTSSNIPAGTVLSVYLAGSDGVTTLTNVTTSQDLTADISISGFTVTDPMGIAGDGIFIYQDSDANPYFIAGLNNSSGTVDASNWNTSIGATLRDSMLPNGFGSQNALTNGSHAVGLPGGGSQQDNVQYNGPTSTADRATWLARVTNASNWTGDNVGTTTGSYGTTLSVGTPNTAPVVANLNGDSVSFIEGGSAVLLDASGNATVTDSDSANFDGGNVTAAIISNRVSGEDVLSLVNQGTGAGQIGVSGANVTYGGTTIGSSTGGTGTNDLVITLNANATPTSVQALIRVLTYSNTNGTQPSGATRTGRVTVSDGDGGTSSNADVSVAVIGVNDAPTLAATGGAPTFTENGSAVDLFSGVTIGAGETGQNITGLTLTVANVANGSSELLGVDGADVTLTNGASGVTATNTLLYSVSVTGGTATLALSKGAGISPAAAASIVDNLSYRNTNDAPTTGGRVVTLVALTDSGGTANGGADTTALSVSATVTVVAANDAPVVTTSGGSATFTEGADTTSTPVVVDAGVTVTDPDTTTLAAATVTITGNFASGQDVLAFTNTNATVFGNISSSYDASTGTLTLTSAGATATVTQWQSALRAVSYTNSSDTPSTATRTASIAVTDGTDTSTAATRAISVTSVNDSPAVTAPASIAVTEDVASVLTGVSFADPDAGSNAITATFSVGAGTLWATSGGGVTVGGSGTTSLTLTGSTANLSTFISGSNVGYTSAPNASGNVSLVVGINDGGNTGSGGTLTDSETVTLAISAVNDAPTLAAPGSIAVTEDVATAVTGISIADVDAGSSSVTATLSLGSGTLAATSGGGVTVSGSGTGTVSLTGSVANLNGFIAASGVAFTTASNATSNVTLNVGVNDGGNTGSGGAQSTSTTVTLSVSAVNDAPVNSLPAPQTVLQDGTLVLSPGNSNQLTITDADAGSGSVQVTLTASNGLVSLSGTTGLTFSVGTGTGDATMTFGGSLTHINNALNGLAFTPTGGYSGAASLQVTTNDQGLTGSGGAQTDTDTLAITVVPPNPVVTTVSANTANGTYKPGDTITITVTFSQVVSVDTTGGVPTLLLETGTTDRHATYVAGSGSTTLSFAYTVQAGDVSSDLDYANASALALNGATFRNAAQLNAVLTLPTVGGPNSLGGQKALVVDGVRPTVTSVSVPANGTYVAGQTLDLTVQWSEAVTVVNATPGTPQLPVSLDAGGTVSAAYVGGTGSTTLLFRLTVQAGQEDLTGITLGAALQTGGATVRDAAGNDATLDLNAVGATTAVLVDARGPSVTAVGVPAPGTYGLGQPLDFTVSWSEPIVVDTSTGAPSLEVTLDQGAPLVATYVATANGTTMLFRGFVTAGQVDATGVTVATLAAPAGALEDAVGNAASLVLANVASTSGVLVDAEAPGITIGAPSVSSTSRGPVSFLVTYIGASAITLTPADVTLIATGTAAGIVTVSGTGTSSRLVTIDQISGAGALAIRVAAGTATDAGGNAAPQSATSASVQVVARALTSVSPTSGLASGGVAVVLRGVGFLQLTAPSVLVGGQAVRALTVRGDGEIDLVTPTLAAGAAVDVVLLDGGSVVHTLAAAYTPLAPPASPETDTDGDTLPDAWELQFGLDPLTSADAQADPDGDGVSSRDEATRGTHPRGFYRRALAEGVVSDAYATSLAIFNPGLARASVVTQYLPATAAAISQSFALDPAQTHRVAAHTVAGLTGAFSTWIESDQPIAAEGLTTWDASRYGGGAEQATAPASTWYLAEGSTVGRFDLFYLIANPTAADVALDVTFLRPAPAAPIVQRHVVAARSRLTLWVNTLDPGLASTDVSAVITTTGGEGVVVERAMYLQDDSGRWGNAGHRAAGVAQPATTWHFAEGVVGAAFDTYLLVANPTATDATIEVDVFGEAGWLATVPRTVAARSRLTLFGGDLTEARGAVAFTVRSTSGTPVVAERAMWWPTGSVAGWSEAHASAGQTTGARDWALADLRVGGEAGDAQYVLVQNLEASPVSLDLLVYVAGATTPVTRTLVIPAAARLSLDLGAEVPETAGQVASAIVRATGRIVVEASRYWDAGGSRWAAGVNVAAVPLP